MFDIDQILRNVEGVDKASYNKILAKKLYEDYKY